MTRQETAKRATAQPWWKWREGMAATQGDGSMWNRITIEDLQAGLFAADFPCLTDWATTGILLGMVVEIMSSLDCPDFVGACLKLFQWIPTLFNKKTIPGQAIAELLMELRKDESPEGGEHE